MLKLTDQPLVMPYPREMKLGNGSVALTSVAVHAGDATARKAARVRKRELKALGLPVADDGYRVSLVRLDQPGVDDELYSLEVGESGAVIAAATYAGMYYGVQTFVQLVIRARLVEAHQRHRITIIRHRHAQRLQFALEHPRRLARRGVIGMHRDRRDIHTALAQLHLTRVRHDEWLILRLQHSNHQLSVNHCCGRMRSLVPCWPG